MSLFVFRCGGRHKGALARTAGTVTSRVQTGLMHEAFHGDDGVHMAVTQMDWPGADTAAQRPAAKHVPVRPRPACHVNGVVCDGLGGVRPACGLCNDMHACSAC
jgi:hypothetical protein